MSSSTSEAGCDALKLYEQLSKYLPPGGNTYGTTEMVAEVISGARHDGHRLAGRRLRGL